jgi:hypothetical protein
MKRRSIKVAGMLFTAEGPGRYLSKCGRYGIFHMLAGRLDQQWELHEVGKDGSINDLITYALTMGDVVTQVEKNDCSERANFKFEEAT